MKVYNISKNYYAQFDILYVDEQLQEMEDILVFFEVLGENTIENFVHTS